VPLPTVPELIALLPPRRKYLVGVSGGADSVALLHLLLEAGIRQLVVCHVDHQLRGRASRGDARFVASLCKRHGLICESARLPVSAIAAQR
jgi:tRNA(Ile)-lysidine synthase